MKRRDLILGAGALGLAAPTKTKAANQETFKWKMVTTWQGVVGVAWLGKK